MPPAPAAAVRPPPIAAADVQATGADRAAPATATATAIWTSARRRTCTTTAASAERSQPAPDVMMQAEKAADKTAGRGDRPGSISWSLVVGRREMWSGPPKPTTPRQRTWPAISSAK